MSLIFLITVLLTLHNVSAVRFQRLTKYLSNYTLEEGYMTRITNDLIPFQNGITEAMIQKAQRYPHTCLIEIQDHRLISHTCLKEYNTYRNLYHTLAKLLPDMKFVLNYNDEPRVLKHRCSRYENWTTCACDRGYQVDTSHSFFVKQGIFEPIYELLPIFSSGTISACFSDILMPSHFHYTFQEQPLIPWEEKTPKATWRGTSTGGAWRKDENDQYDSLHRFRLVSLCKDIPICDVKFSDYQFCEPAICTSMEKKYGKANFIPMERQFHSKILIDIDGFTYSQRFHFYLSSGSVVFKIALFEDIGTVLPKPWEHYLPVKMDLSDLEVKLEWAMNNDGQIKNIGKRGRQLANRSINRLSLVTYMYTLLIEYHKLYIKGQSITQEPLIYYPPVNH